MTAPRSVLAEAACLFHRRWLSTGLAIAVAFSALACVGTQETRRGGVRPPTEQPLMNDFSGPTAPRFTGRFDFTDPKGPRFAWSGSAITLSFIGTGVAADLNDSGKNRFAVIVDGKVLTDQLVLEPGTSTVDLVQGLERGEHTVTLYRLTEPLLGETQFLGFRLAHPAELLATPKGSERRIEIIGDSISAGYGNEGKDPSCTFSAATQNHYQTYGAVAARDLEAELVTVAWSGKGVFSNRGSATDTVVFPELWRRTLPERSDSLWQKPEAPPQVVVINLGTNDFAPEVPDKSPFAGAYAKFVGDVRAFYPDAHLVLTVGPLLTDSFPEGAQALTSARAGVTSALESLKAHGDESVSFLEYRGIQAGEGLGCDYHPTVATHHRMGKVLAAHLREQLGW